MCSQGYRCSVDSSRVHHYSVNSSQRHRTTALSIHAITTKAKLLALLLWLERPTRSLAFSGNGIPPDAPLLLTQEHFGRILHAALEDDATLRHLHAADAADIANDAEGRRLRRSGLSDEFARREEDAWRWMVQHDWDWSRLPRDAATHGRARCSRRNLRRISISKSLSRDISIEISLSL